MSVETVVQNFLTVLSLELAKYYPSQKYLK